MDCALSEKIPAPTCVPSVVMVVNIVRAQSTSHSASIAEMESIKG